MKPLNLVVTILLLLSSVAYAATKEEVLQTLDNQEVVNKANRAIIEMFGEDTQYHFILDPGGYIRVLPMDPEAYAAYQALFGAKELVIYLEEQEGK